MRFDMALTAPRRQAEWRVLIGHQTGPRRDSECPLVESQHKLANVPGVPPIEKHRERTHSAALPLRSHTKRTLPSERVSAHRPSLRLGDLVNRWDEGKISKKDDGKSSHFREHLSLLLRLD